MVHNPALLYVGAGTDVRPVQRYSHIFKTFVYVDGLPSSEYYQDRGVTKEGMISEMKKVLEKEGCPFRVVTPRGGTHAADILQCGNSQIFYFFDTRDTDMWGNNSLAEFLDKHVTTIYMAGYFPTISKPIPHLRELIYTDGCSPCYAEHESMWAFDFRNLKHTGILDYEAVDETLEFFVDCDHCGEVTRTAGV